MCVWVKLTAAWTFFTDWACGTVTILYFFKVLYIKSVELKHRQIQFLAFLKWVKRSNQKAVELNLFDKTLQPLSKSFNLNELEIYKKPIWREKFTHFLRKTTNL